MPVIVPNIGKRQRRLRFWPGLAALLIGVAVVAYFMEAGYPRVYRILAAIPFLMGSIGVLQAREKT